MITGYGSVERIRGRAAERREIDTERVLHVLRRHHPWTFRAIPDPHSLAREFARFPVTVNFHPDRVAADGQTAAGSLLVTGVFRTQFETGTSAGSYSPEPTGARAQWERTLFGLESVDPVHRPRYGGLNIAGHPDGAAPRFGSCVLELNPRTLTRSTLAVGDSHTLPEDIGTIDESMPVLAGLLERADATGAVFRLPTGSVGGLVALLRAPRSSARITEPGRALDDYLEVQVHGPVHLDSDVVGMVLDPSFRGTDIGDRLTDAAATHGVRVRWHRGFRTTPDEIDPQFRGPGTVEMARRVHDTFGAITAETIGRAHQRWATVGGSTSRKNPDSPGASDPGRQLKYLWHALVEFGGPFR